MGKMIILKPDDTIELADYIDFTSLEKAVNGPFERCFSIKLPVNPMLCDGKEIIYCDLYCNDEFLIDDRPEFDKINAVASLLMSNESHIAEIRGNVALLPRTLDCDNRGFEYIETVMDNNEIEEDICECWAAEDVILRFIKQNSEALAMFHERFDNNKSDPSWNITIL